MLRFQDVGPTRPETLAAAISRHDGRVDQARIQPRSVGTGTCVAVREQEGQKDALARLGSAGSMPSE